MDLVITGGNVLTMDDRDRRAEAIAVDGGKIAAVGAGEEISKLVGPQTKVVHLSPHFPDQPRGSVVIR